MSLRAIPEFLRYLVILMREVILASISVTKLVFGPIDRLRSGFVAYPMEAETDLEITTLANSITLTPGTGVTGPDGVCYRFLPPTWYDKAV